MMTHVRFSESWFAFRGPRTCLRLLCPQTAVDALAAPHFAFLAGFLSRTRATRLGCSSLASDFCLDQSSWAVRTQLISLVPAVCALAQLVPRVVPFHSCTFSTVSRGSTEGFTEMAHHAECQTTHGMQVCSTSTARWNRFSGLQLIGGWRSA